MMPDEPKAGLSAAQKAFGRSQITPEGVARARRELAESDPLGELDAVAPIYLEWARKTTVSLPSAWDLVAQEQAERETALVDHLRGRNVVDLMAEEFAPPDDAIPGLIAQGLGVIASPPKVGKSLLAYQMGVELAFGGDLLGVQAKTRAVLYYALEDGPARSKRRVQGLLHGRQSGLERFQIRWEAPRLGGPLEAEVGQWLDKHPAGVVIIDVLAKVRPAGRAGLNAYDEDYASIAGLHNVCRSHAGATVLLITHDRKAGSDDWMTRVTGTRGVTGAADFIVFINRKRGDTIAKIHVTGRDTEDRTFDVEFTPTGWRVAGIEQVIGARSPVRQTIFNWLRENGPAWQKDIAEGAALDIDVVRHRVMDMAKDGQLIGGPDGYGVPTDDR